MMNRQITRLLLIQTIQTLPDADIQSFESKFRTRDLTVRVVGESIRVLLPWPTVFQPALRRKSFGGAAINHGINKNSEIPRTIPNTPQNIAEIFVRQLTVM